MNYRAVNECLISMKMKLQTLEKKRDKYLRTLAFYSTLSVGSILFLQSNLNHNPFKLDKKTNYQVEYLVDKEEDKSKELGEIISHKTDIAELPQQITYKTGWAEVYSKKGRFFRNVRVYDFQNLSYEELKQLTENPYFLFHYHESREADPEYQNYVENLYKDEFIIRMPVNLISMETNQTYLENLKDFFTFAGLSCLAIFLSKGFVYAYYYGKDPKKQREEEKYIKCYKEEIKILENEMSLQKRKRK